MANLTKKEIIERGYLTDVAIANSDLGVDDPKFKAAITNSFYYDMIYGGDTSHKVEEAMDVQEPITVVAEVVEPQDVIETSTESVLLEEDLKEEIEEPTVEEVVVEEPIIDECPLYEAAPVVVEEPTVEVVEEVVEEEVLDPVEPEATVEEVEDETTEK